MSGQCESYREGVFTVAAAHWINRRQLVIGTRSLLMISSGQRFLISKSNAVFLASFLGVFVTLVSTRLWVLYSAFVRWVFKRIVRSSSGTRPLRNETIPLLSRSTNAGRSHIQM